MAEYLLSEVYCDDKNIEKIVNGMNPHHYSPSLPLFKAIIEIAHIDPNNSWYNGRLPIHCACNHFALAADDVLRYILLNKLYPNINILTRDGRDDTPIMLAVKNTDNAERKVRLLCEIGGNGIEISKQVLSYATTKSM